LKKKNHCNVAKNTKRCKKEGEECEKEGKRRVVYKPQVGLISGL
jgi:hypothetical protein